MAADMDFKNLSFSRLRDLVDIDMPKNLEEMTYVANASNFRRALLNTFTKPGWSWDQVRQMEDQCMTYRGYIKFLQTDLETVYPVDESRSKSAYKKGIEYIAKQMMARGEVSSFSSSQALLLTFTRPLPMQFDKGTLIMFVYLSIHQLEPQSFPSVCYQLNSSTRPRGIVAWLID